MISKIYVNGVNTSKGHGLRDAEKLSSMFGGAFVFNFFNPSINIVTALVESFVLRWCYWFYTPPIVRVLSLFLREQIDASVFTRTVYRDGTLIKITENRRVNVVAHSEGTAIASNAVRLLSKSDRKHISLHLFANVASHEPEGCYVEFFHNDDDYVVSNLPGATILRFLRRFCKRKGRGPKFVRRGGGHSFISSYLDNIYEFSGVDESEFYRLLKGDR